jgi:hypothetical protein
MRQIYPHLPVIFVHRFQNRQKFFMLRITLLTFFAICFLSIKSYSQDKDSIILYNGQVLIGAVQDASLGVISIDDIDMKMLNIRLFKIKRLVIQERFKIETVDKRIIYGSMKTVDRDGWVVIHTLDGEDIPLHITRLFLLISMDANFFKRLNGNISAGLSFTKSSGIGQVNFSANIQFATRKVDYQLMASSIGSIDTGNFSRDNENAQLLASYELTSTWFVAAQAQYQRNLELSISRRYLGLVGPGNRLFIKKNWRLMAITGITFSQEKSTEGVSSGLLFEVPVMLQFNYYQFRHPDIQISSTQTAYFSLSQQGRVRYDGTTNFSWQLIRYFYLNISPYTNFDSKPPAGSGSTFDYGIVIGLSYKF